ncbi:hypothetical protein NFI96_001402 [Prochilodus magdalenae]|nr:hypothetical protein NFI96_001402 [Prochilodus magdalenae]
MTQESKILRASHRTGVEILLTHQDCSPDTSSQSWCRLLDTRSAGDGVLVAQEFGDCSFLFQHDCVPLHKARFIKTWMSEFGVEEHQVDWPAQSPDLNPKEHLWDELERRLQARPSRPTSVPDLTNGLLEEWSEVRAKTRLSVRDLQRKPHCECVFMLVDEKEGKDEELEGRIIYCAEGGRVARENKPLMLVLTTVPTHPDSLVDSTKTKAGLVTEDDPLPF